MNKKIIALAVILLALTSNVARCWEYFDIYIVNSTGKDATVGIWDTEYQKLYADKKPEILKPGEKKKFQLVDSMKYTIRWSFIDDDKKKICNETYTWTTIYRDMDKPKTANLFELHKNTYDVHGPWLFKKHIGSKAKEYKCTN